MTRMEEIAKSLEQGENERVAALVRQAIDDGARPATILEEGLIAGMSVIGERFREHEIFLPDVLLAAKAMYAGLDLLEPLLTEKDMPRRAKVVLGSVQGDLHDIGKNLVGIMLRGAGFEVVDLGNNVPAERFVETAASEGASIIGMSALLTTTMTGMGKVVELVRERGLSNVKVIVGGAPVSEEFAREIGADAYGYDATSAVERVKALVEAR